MNPTGRPREYRLHLFMSRCGVGSRRTCERYIRDGRVAVNGRIVMRMGSRVVEGDTVCLDGKALALTETRIYLALHKPPGYLCSNSDRFGRPLAGDLIKARTTLRTFHVGRLDLLSSGLIFYTNDGDFANAVAHPSRKIEKVYRLETKKSIPDSLLENYKRGITVEGQRYKLHSFKRLGERRVYLTLLEGKNREIRRVFASEGLLSVHRVRIGPVSLRGLKPGQSRFLESDEVKWFIERR